MCMIVGILNEAYSLIVIPLSSEVNKKKFAKTELLKMWGGRLE